MVYIVNSEIHIKCDVEAVGLFGLCASFDRVLNGTLQLSCYVVDLCKIKPRQVVRALLMAVSASDRYVLNTEGIDVNYRDYGIHVITQIY